MADLSVNFLGIDFKNPIVPASGTFGYGKEYEEFYPLSKLGGISVKGTTFTPRDGNLPPRIAETKGGMLNSVGLQNPGVDAFISKELPRLEKSGTITIVNFAGSTAEECAEVAQKLDATSVPMLELNISCPNVKQGGAAFGTCARSAAEVTKIVRKATKKPLMVKLSPNVTDITEIAKAVESEGADAISLINTLLGMKIDINTRRPVLHNNVGGLSGEGILPVAVRMVWQVANAVKVPICGMGGVSTYKDALELIMAGASLIQIGAAIFTDPYAPLKVIDGLEKYLDEKNVPDIKSLIGAVQPW